MHASYASSILSAPAKPPVYLPQTLSDVSVLKAVCSMETASRFRTPFLEIWHTNSYEKYSHPEDEPRQTAGSGFYRLRRYCDQRRRKISLHHLQARTRAGCESKAASFAHFDAGVFARLAARCGDPVLVPNEPVNDSDPAMKLVEPWRRETIIAKNLGMVLARSNGNVILPGSNETVSFDCDLS